MASKKPARRNPFVIVGSSLDLAGKKWLWVMRAPNGAPVAESWRTYSSPSKARRALAGVLRQLGKPLALAVTARIER